MGKYRLTLVHPCIGRRPGERYMRSWQMEPLPLAVIAGLTPKDVEVRLYDDRMEAIPYDQPTDLCAISVETYTAKRAYQIASEFRRRRVPVVMGGFHATLSSEVPRYADSVVQGEAEELWPQVIDDYRSGRPQKIYRSSSRPSLSSSTPDRSVYGGRSYLPVALVESGRGCRFNCEFCAIQTMFRRSYTRRPVGQIVDEIRALKAQRRSPRLYFFVDDNFIAVPEEAKEVLSALIPLRIRWVSQASINIAHDEEMLRLLEKSGCAGLLIGFESLNAANLRKMGKTVNMMKGGFEVALANLRRHRIRLYVTFLFGYDEDTPDTFAASLEFAQRHAFYITAFNHVTPFPGTPLYTRLEQEGRLLYKNWWLDDTYSYNRIPFRPLRMTPEELRLQCVATRRAFYSLKSIVKRGLDPVNRSDLFLLQAFFPINLLHRFEVGKRDLFPLGDQSYRGTLLEAA